MTITLRAATPGVGVRVAGPGLGLRAATPGVGFGVNATSTSAGAPTYIASTAMAVANTATSVQQTPTSTQQNDLMIARVVARGDGQTLTTPAGWTIIGSAITDTSTTPDTISACYWRLAGATESSPYTFSCGSSSTIAVVIDTIRYANTSTPIDVQGGAAVASSVTWTASSVTTTQANTLLLFVGAGATTQGIAPNGALIERSETSGGTSTVNLYLATETDADTGATGSRSVTLDSARAGIARLIALAPLAYAASLWSQGSTTGAPATYGGAVSFVRLLTDTTQSGFSSGVINLYRTSGPYYETGPFEITGGRIHLVGGASTSSVRIVVGTVTGGVPDAPLAASDEFSVPATNAATFDFTFTPAASFSGSGEVAYYVGVWCNVQVSIRTISLGGSYLSDYSIWRSGAATYASTGAPPAPTGGMTSGGTTANREFAVEVNTRPAAPAAPTGLTATASGVTIALSWNASTNAQRYLIRRGGVAVATVTGTSWTDRGLAASTNYSYTVAAERGSVLGSESSSANATTGAGAAIDRRQVLTPSSYSGSIGPNTIMLGWHPTYVAGSAPSYRMPSTYRSPVEDQRGGINVNWNQIQTTSDPAVYDWSIIDNALSAAEGRGARLIVQVRSLVPGSGNVCPSFVTAGTTLGGDFVMTWSDSNNRTWWRNLVLAMGTRYGADRRLLAVAANYGDYGERICDTPRDTAAPSAATAALYDQDLADAFGTSHAIMFYATGGAEGVASLDSILGSYTNAAVRSQAWGENTAMRQTYFTRGGLSRMRLRDKRQAGRAGLVMESIGSAPTSTQILWMRDIAQDSRAPLALPVMAMAERNFSTYASYGATDQGYIDAITTAIGARLRLAAAQAPERIASGNTTTLLSAWALSGTNGVFVPYTVQWQLRNTGTGALVASANSAIDVTAIPLLGDSSATTYADNVTLSASAGTYTLGVQLIAPSGDPSGPLRLYQAGEQTGSWYSLGTIVVE